MSDHIALELRQFTNVGRATFKTSDHISSELRQFTNVGRATFKTSDHISSELQQFTNVGRVTFKTSYHIHRKCDSLQTSEARQFGKRQKSDACSEVREELSIMRHFLSVSELRRYDKPHFVGIAIVCKRQKSNGLGNVTRATLVWKRRKKCRYCDTFSRCRNCDVMANHIFSVLALSLL